MKTEIAQALEKKYGKKNPPRLQAGDTVRVHQRIKEGDKERVQVFEGLVIALKHGMGLDGSYTVRKISAGGVGVERTFPVHSPNVVKVERIKTASVARAKLYYMRERLGKRARFKHEGANYGVWDESAVVPEEVVEEAATTLQDDESGSVTVMEATEAGDIVETPASADEIVDATGAENVEVMAEKMTEEEAAADEVAPSEEFVEKVEEASEVKEDTK